LDDNVYTGLINSLQPQQLENLIRTYADAIQTNTLPYSKIELLNHLKFIGEQQKIVAQAGQFLSTHPFLHFFSHRLTELSELIKITQALQEVKGFLTQYLNSQTAIEWYMERKATADVNVQELLLKIEENQKLVEALNEKVRSEVG